MVYIVYWYAKLAAASCIEKALEILEGRARIKRAMWSRRAQEYDAKINSGDILAIAEVVRDLYRTEDQPERSYSERQLYDLAFDRLAREVSIVKKLSFEEVFLLIEERLKAPAPSRGKLSVSAKSDADAIAAA